MKKYVILLLLIYINKSYSQTNMVSIDNFKITTLKAFYNQNKFGGDRNKFGSDPSNLEVLFKLHVYLKIEGFDLGTPIDFNNFSLTEDKFMLRQHPLEVLFRNYWILKYDLKELHSEDLFLKYSIPNYTNYDYFYKENPFNSKKARQERFCILNIPKKKNKSNEFRIIFPVKHKETDTYKLYYKDVLLKTFILEKGKILKFN